MADLKSLDSPFNKKATQYKNRRTPNQIEIYDLTLEADGEEMAGFCSPRLGRALLSMSHHLTVNIFLVV